MSEVRKWLEAIGITQYANVFEANDLDMDLPRQVDDQKLKDIGVSSAGHRLRISNAIAKLGPEGTLGKGVNARNAVNGPTTANSRSSRACRYLTVMFCDLVG